VCWRLVDVGLRRAPMSGVERLSAFSKDTADLFTAMGEVTYPWARPCRTSAPQPRSVTTMMSAGIQVGGRWASTWPSRPRRRGV